jgi:hypothetical protein
MSAASKTNVHFWWVEHGKLIKFRQYADTEQLARLS